MVIGCIFRTSLLQWGDVASVVLIACVLLSDQIKTMSQLGTAAAFAGICPGLRMATLVSFRGWVQLVKKKYKHS